MSAPLDPQLIHSLIVKALEMRDRAYAPYSKFRVGAAVLTRDGTIVGGCNVENNSPGAGVCAERNAIPKAIAEGHTQFTACAVTGMRPEPSLTPCGVCRQMMREHFPLSAPIFLAAGTYPASENHPPEALVRCLEDLSRGTALEAREKAGYTSLVRVLTLEELYPFSFGRGVVL